MNKITFLLFTILFSFCAQGQGLYFDSILPPHIKLNNDSLEITISYREYKRHKFKVKINTSKKEIILSAKPLSSIYSTKKIIDLKRYKNIEDFNAYWLDPDGNKTKIPIYYTNKQDVPYYSSVFPFREGNNWFYVDSNLNKISDNFDFVYPFYSEYSIVKINDKYALINKKMSLITMPVFDSIQFVNYDLKKDYPYFSVAKNNKYFRIDTLGQKYFGAINNHLQCGFVGLDIKFRNTKIYKQNGKTGFTSVCYDNRGEYDTTITFEAIYDSIFPIAERIGANLLVQINNKKGILDYKGNEKLPVIYDEIVLKTYKGRSYISNGAILVCINDKFGFVNSDYQNITELKYLDALPFAYGFSLVKNLNGNWGYIDGKGREYWR